ncbi:MAG: hypothetical protein MGU50_06185 [Trichodesmium sp. MAG_R02]|nr:hypothetical protein [Trichodesmium sp. MAG_R02]
MFLVILILLRNIFVPRDDDIAATLAHLRIYQRGNIPSLATIIGDRGA